MSKQNECFYCHTLNAEGTPNCVACGAPMEKKISAPLDLTPKVTVVKSKPQPKPAPKREPKPEENLRKVGESADKVYNTALYTYNVAWRTLAEVIAISVSAFIIGMVGGATEMQFWGVLGALLVGLAVGRTAKRFHMTLISAPFGALLGLAISFVFWFIDWGIKVPVFLVTLMALTAAGLGGRPWERRRKNFWENARPYIGGLGGMVFGIIGMLLGWVLIAAVQQLIQ